MGYSVAANENKWRLEIYHCKAGLHAIAKGEASLIKSCHGLKDKGREGNPRNASFLPTLFVDVDGTLIRTDLLVEALIELLKKKFLYFLLLPLWLVRGKAHFKQQIADRVELEVSLLPFNVPFLRFLEHERAAGRSMILATASNNKFACKISENLGLFEKVLASDLRNNLSGTKKLEKILEVCGEGGFVYAGNSRADLAIWRLAKGAVLVNPDEGLCSEAAKVTKVEHVFDDREKGIKTLLRGMRLHQWAKNLLIFVPLITSHKMQNAMLLTHAVFAFFSFSFCASAVYVINDLIDLPSDRQHPRKRNRPFASGDISLLKGVSLIPCFLLASIAFGMGLPYSFVNTLLVYLVMTSVYSLWAKHIDMLDVIVLAGLYTIRIIAGGFAVSVPLSFWLIAFSMFFFFSLALAKRYAELFALQRENISSAYGRSYFTNDLNILSQFGCGSGYLSVLVLAFYINSEAVLDLYRHQQMIWFLCPLLLYWISRVWLLASRGQLCEDPVVFAISDRISQCLVAFGLAILWCAA